MKLQLLLVLSVVLPAALAAASPVDDVEALVTFCFQPASTASLPCRDGLVRAKLTLCSNELT